MQRSELIYKRVEELQLNTKNPRKNEHAVDTVAKSIEQYGFKAPLIIDKKNIVYCGNTRLKAARKLGLEEVPCIVVTDLTEKEIREYALLDNKTNEIADWDLEMLAEELKELSLEEFALDWEIPELESEKEIVEDNCDIEEKLEEEPICKRGEVWKLGNHRLMCGDSTKKEDMQKLMKGEKADLIVTDPPYNVAVKNAQGMTIANDNLENEAFKNFLAAAFKNMEECLKAGGVFYVWYASKEHINFESGLQAAGLQVREQLIWKKNHFILGRQDYHWQHEPCMYGWKEGAKHYFIEDRTQSTVLLEDKLDFTKLKKEEMLELLQEIYNKKINTTVLEEDKPLINELHPTMKPVRLLARLIENSSREEERVLDPFVGSGSSIIACEQLNRKCYAMELDEQYASVTIKRWEEFTGRKAVKENDGKTITEFKT